MHSRSGGAGRQVAAAGKAVGSGGAGTGGSPVCSGARSRVPGAAGGGRGPRRWPCTWPRFLRGSPLFCLIPSGSHCLGADVDVMRRRQKSRRAAQGDGSGTAGAGVHGWGGRVTLALRAVGRVFLVRSLSSGKLSDPPGPTHSDAYDPLGVSNLRGSGLVENPKVPGTVGACKGPCPPSVCCPQGAWDSAGSLPPSHLPLGEGWQGWTTDQMWCLLERGGRALWRNHQLSRKR